MGGTPCLKILFSFLAHPQSILVSIIYGATKSYANKSITFVLNWDADRTWVKCITRLHRKDLYKGKKRLLVKFKRHIFSLNAFISTFIGVNCKGRIYDK